MPHVMTYIINWYKWVFLGRTTLDVNAWMNRKASTASTMISEWMKWRRMCTSRKWCAVTAAHVYKFHEFVQKVTVGEKFDRVA